MELTITQKQRLAELGAEKRTWSGWTGC